MFEMMIFVILMMWLILFLFVLWGCVLMVFVWLFFFSEIIIIGMGGVVWFIGLGFGCIEWFLCIFELLVFIVEVQGIYGMIEFGNWLMMGVVGIIVLVFVFLVLCLFSGC